MGFLRLIEILKYKKDKQIMVSQVNNRYLKELRKSLEKEHGFLVYEYLLKRNIPVRNPVHLWATTFFIPFEENMDMKTDVVFFDSTDDCPYISNIEEEVGKIFKEGNWYKNNDAYLFLRKENESEWFKK